MEKKKRYIEDLRIISMLAVVMIHVCITALSDFPDSGSTLWRVIYQSIRNILRFAVPVFFMISGALLLNPQKVITLEKLIKKYIVKYTAVIVIFGWAFALIEEVFHHRDFSFSYLGTSFVNMLQGQTWNHMWYMYSLLGVTMILPLLKAATATFTKKEMQYFVIVCFLFLSVIPYFCALTGKESGVHLAISSVYALYMIVGYLLDTYRPKNTIVYLVIIVAGVVMLILEAYFTIVLNRELAFSNYNSPVVFLFSVAVFALVCSKEIPNKQENVKLSKVKSFLSVNSFGVYIIHMLWINLIYKFLKWNPFSFNAFAGLIIIWIVVTGLSLLSTVIMRHIVVLKKLI